MFQHTKDLFIKMKMSIIQSNRTLIKENTSLRKLIKHWQRLINLSAESATLEVLKEAFG